MLKVEQAVRELLHRNAYHAKKKRRLANSSWSELMDNMDEEVQELQDALSVFVSNSPEVLEELGDILGVLVHATLKAGFSMEQVEQRELAKLKERFPHNETPLLNQVTLVDACSGISDRGPPGCGLHPSNFPLSDEKLEKQILQGQCEEGNRRTSTPTEPPG